MQSGRRWGAATGKGGRGGLCEHERMSRTKPLLATATVLLVLATACSSTTTGQKRGSAGLAESRDGLDSAPHENADAIRGPGRTGTARRASRSVGGEHRPAGVERKDARIGTVPGVTASEIKVGAPILENGSEANRALGNEGISTGDQRRVFDILFDDLNKRGGILKRKVVPVYHAIDALSTENADSQAQAACTTFTEDNEVFAALGGLNDTFLACMSKSNGVQVVSELTNSSTARFRRFPRYVEVSSANLDRQAAAWPPHLKAMGYFDRGARVGILTFDDPHFRHAMNEVLTPGLRQSGFPPQERYLIEPAQRFADNGGVVAEIQNAVLRFKSRGITHVLILDERAFLTDFFMEGAQDQQYFPRYGFNTQNAIGYLVSEGQLPPEQLKGAVGIGWSPFIGMGAAQDPDAAGNSPRKRCLALLARNGMSFDDRNAQAIALLQCDMVWFLEAAIEVDGPVSAEQFVANVHRLGSSYLSPVSFANRFGPDRHDGSSALRRLAYFESCTCVKYTSSLIGF